MLGALIHSCTVRYTLEGEADASVASPAHVQRFFFLPSARGDFCDNIGVFVQRLFAAGIKVYVKT